MKNANAESNNDSAKSRLRAGSAGCVEDKGCIIWFFVLLVAYLITQWGCAYLRNKKADSTIAKAESAQDEAEAELTLAKTTYDRALKALGETKVTLLTGSVRRYMEAQAKMGSIPGEATEVRENGKADIDGQAIQEPSGSKEITKVVVPSPGEISENTAGSSNSTVHFYTLPSLTAKTAIALGLAVSSKPTISALVNAAYISNSHLYMTGGFLSARPLNIAIMTPIVEGTVLVSFWDFMPHKKNSAAKKNLKEANDKAAEIQKDVEGKKLIASAYLQIAKRADLYRELLEKLNRSYLPLVAEIENIVKQKGNNYSQYSGGNKMIISIAASFTSNIKKLLNTPIITENGSLNEESLSVAEEVEDFLTDAQKTLKDIIPPLPPAENKKNKMP